MEQSRLVDAFVYGNHLHYKGMPECQDCVRDNTNWDRMYKHYGALNLAQKLRRSPNYRAFVQARPFDDTEAILSLEMLTDGNGYEHPNGEESPEFAYLSGEIVEQFLQTLTPKQQAILRLLIRGWKPKEIYRRFGYRNTGGIRYHKYIIRQKWNSFDN